MGGSALAFCERDGICTWRTQTPQKGGPCSSSSCTVGLPHDGVVVVKDEATNSVQILMPVIGRQIRGPSPLTQSSPSSNGTSRCAHGNVPDESLPQFTAPKTVRATGRRRIRGTTAGACKVTSDTGTRRKCRRMWSSVWTSIAGSSSPGHPFSSPAPICAVWTPLLRVIGTGIQQSAQCR